MWTVSRRMSARDGSRHRAADIGAAPATGVACTCHDRRSRPVARARPHGARCPTRQLGRPPRARDLAALPAARALRPADRRVAAAVSLLVGAGAGGALDRSGPPEPLVSGALLRR